MTNFFRVFVPWEDDKITKWTNVLPVVSIYRPLALVGQETQLLSSDTTIWLKSNGCILWHFTKYHHHRNHNQEEGANLRGILFGDHTYWNNISHLITQTMMIMLNITLVSIWAIPYSTLIYKSYKSTSEYDKPLHAHAFCHFLI